MLGLTPGATASTSGGDAARVRRALFAAASLCLFLLALPPGARASYGKPTIGLVSAEYGETSGTLKATIRPDGLQTTYKFWIERGGVRTEAGQGEIDAGRLEAPVSVKVSLEASTAYTWAVIAENQDGAVGKEGPSFTSEGPPSPGLPEGSGPLVPYEPTPPDQWGIEQAIRSGDEAPHREAELEAKQKHEEEEKAAHERAIREAGERAGREAAERERLAAMRAVRCIVPRLTGQSLRSARRELRRAHCALGVVRRPKHAHGARLVVRGQGTKPGQRLHRGARVGVRLAAAARHSRRLRSRASARS